MRNAGAGGTAIRTTREVPSINLDIAGTTVALHNVRIGAAEAAADAEAYGRLAATRYSRTVFSIWIFEF